MYVCVYMLVSQLCPTLCDPMDSSPPGSSVHRASQVRILEWVAISFSRDLLDPGIEPQSPALKVDALLSGPRWKMGPNNPCLQIFMRSCVTFSLWVWAGTSDSLPIKRRWQKWWYVTFEFRLQKDSVLPLCLEAFTLVEASCHGMTRSYTEAHVAKDWCVQPKPARPRGLPTLILGELEGDFLQPALRWL